MCYKHLPVIQKGCLSGKHNCTIFCSEKQTLSEKFSSGSAKIAKHFEHGKAVTDNLFVCFCRRERLFVFVMNYFSKLLFYTSLNGNDI